MIKGNAVLSERRRLACLGTQCVQPATHWYADSSSAIVWVLHSSPPAVYWDADGSSAIILVLSVSPPAVYWDADGSSAIVRDTHSPPPAAHPLSSKSNGTFRSGVRHLFVASLIPLLRKYVNDWHIPCVAIFPVHINQPMSSAEVSLAQKSPAPKVLSIAGRYHLPLLYCSRSVSANLVCRKGHPSI